ncbi:MAG TPA: efflux RND transporter periplasmic adaptor subunit [Gemmatimonadaceae bacterium]|jgi:HlyD family secretion protein|nr:efflux RND transporter periplasmic adaptor subunit [Gemmatimonadaceae bacterium]
MSRRTKWSIGVIALLLIAGVVALSAARGGNKGVEVRMEPVQKRDLVASVTASGKVEPRTKVDLSADITGRIVRLAVKEGQMVSKGQFLLEIDPAIYQAAVQRQDAALAAARAEAVRAKASYDNALSQYNRLNQIKQSNPTLIADEEIERLKTTAEVNHAAYEAARHNVAQTEATVRDARSSLAKTVIVSPMAGRITRLNVELGETAIMGTLNKDAATLLTISDMSVLETLVKVDETDVARISVGDSAIVEIDAFPDTTFVGKVVEISNSSVISPTTGQQADQAVDYEVRVQLLDPPPETRPDFSTTAKIITATRNAVLSIPIIALTVREHEPNENRDSAQVALGRRAAKEVGKRDVEGVFVVGSDSKVTFRPVKIGIAGEEYFEVMSGLTDGERIVAGSYQAIRELKEGTVVREAKKTEKKDGDKTGAKT